MRLKLDASTEETSSPTAPPARTGSPPRVMVPKVRVSKAVTAVTRRTRPEVLVYGASMGRHQNSFQPRIPSTMGMIMAAMPKSWFTSSSARKAPMGPMKLRAGPTAPDLKKGEGSRGS